MKANQQSITLKKEYLIHYSDGPGDVQIIVVSDPYSTLFHAGQTRKVIKVERREVEVIRTLLNSEDVSDIYKKAMSMWDHRFTRIHDPYGNTHYISDSKKAKEIYPRLIEIHGKDQVKVDALVNVYIAKKFTRDMLVSLEDLVANKWGSTCRASLLTEDGQLDLDVMHGSQKCALSIVVLDTDEHLKELVETLAPKSDLTLVVLCPTSLKMVCEYDDYGWKVLRSTRIYILHCLGETELYNRLNGFVLSNVNARYLAPQMQ